MYNKDLILKFIFAFIIFFFVYILTFPTEFFRDFFRILLVLYRPSTRIGIVVILLIVYIVYVFRANSFNDSNKLYHITFAISAALFINVMLQLLSEKGLLFIFEFPFLVNKYEFIETSLLTTLMIAIPYIIFVFSSQVNTHSLSELAINALFLIISLFLTIVISLKEINMYFDKSEPTIIEGSVISKRASSAYKKTGQKIYYVTYSGYEEREVPSSTYREVEFLDKVNIYIKDGYLGAKWVSKVEKKQ